MLFLTMIPPSCFLGVFATSFYIKGVIWRSFLQKKKSNWIYYQYDIPWWLEIHQYSHIQLYRVLNTALTLQKVIFYNFFQMIHTFDLISIYKIEKKISLLKSCMQISALCIKFNDQSVCNFILQYHKRFFNDFQIYQILDILLQMFIHQWQNDCIQ